MQRALRAVGATVLIALAACGAVEPAAPVAEARFSGQAAVKAAAAGRGWMVLLETLQPQFLVTVPDRKLAFLNDTLAEIRTAPAIDGWTLIDAAGHPSGDVSALYVRVDFISGQAPAMRTLLARHRLDGSRADTEVEPVPPADPSDVQTDLVFSLDRARIVASGEDVHVAVRWVGNAVHAYRFRFTGQELQEEWATRVEPDAAAFVVGIIGGGFDNFHQGDSSIFVYLDVDAAGNTYVVVPSTETVLERHDAAFGDDLLSGADPGSFDFGAAVLTRLDPAGGRVYARLLGVPGRARRLLNARVAGGSVLLLGRVRTGDEPGSWDAWMLRADAATGAVEREGTIDVSGGDMFWDAAALSGGDVLAVGTTAYTQNPAGLSVSDEREALAVRLGADGQVLERLDLPHGAEPRGNEAISVRAEGGRLVISGMLDGPGTHAEVRSDGFLLLR